MRLSHQIAFEVTTDPDGREVLAAIGDVDRLTAPELRKRIEALAQPGKTLVIDLRYVTNMDSPGLGTIVHCDQIQRDQGGELVMRNPSGDVRALLDVVHPTHPFTIE